MHSTIIILLLSIYSILNGFICYQLLPHQMKQSIVHTQVTSRASDPPAVHWGMRAKDRMIVPAKIMTTNEYKFRRMKMRSVSRLN